MFARINFLLATATAALAATMTMTDAQALRTELPYTLGAPTFFGSGCPKDSVRVVPSTDRKTLSVLFSQFSSATSEEKLREKKNCNLAVNLDIKPGFSVAITKVDYRGNAYVPEQYGAYAQFDAEYFFAGHTGPTTQYRYNTGFNEDIFISNTVETLKWSKCGISTNFRINVGATAYKSGSDKEDVQIAIDTSDAKLGGFHYTIEIRRC